MKSYSPDRPDHLLSPKFGPPTNPFVQGTTSPNASIKGNFKAPDSNPLNFLMHMMSRPGNTYGGSVDSEVKKDRRRKNKIARKQRKLNARHK